MEKSLAKTKISVVIPAFNEEKRIRAVLNVVTQAPFIDEIIVVDDGSKDKTAAIARKYPITLIRHKKNQGKGGALQTGVRAAGKADILLFLDADLINLKKEHLKLLIDPVINNEADMTLGYLSRDIKKATNLASRLVKGISGQRALKKSFLENIWEIKKVANLGRSFWAKISGLRALDKRKISELNLKNSGFGADLIITRYFKRKKGRIKLIELKGLTHVTQEEKLGFKKGLKEKIKMYREILRGRNLT